MQIWSEKTAEKFKLKIVLNWKFFVNKNFDVIFLDAKFNLNIKWRNLRLKRSIYSANFSKINMNYLIN